MKHKQFWVGVCSFLGLLALILDGKTAAAGAEEGVQLCIRTVIPSLFPFFFLSILFTDAMGGQSLPFLKPVCRLCKIPEEAAPILIPAFLGGYPTGAQAVARAYQAGNLARQDAIRMLAFCNNAGPAFLFGMIASMFPGIRFAWALWAIHIAGALLTAAILPGNCSPAVMNGNGKETSLSQVLWISLRNMASVCAWVILFRVVIAFGNRWIFSFWSSKWRVYITGLLELTNGCCELAAVSDLSLRFLFCSVWLAFGGVCITMQTISVTGNLPLTGYWKGKLLQVLFSVLLSVSIMKRTFLPCLLCILAIAAFLRIREKKSSVPTAIGV